MIGGILNKVFKQSSSTGIKQRGDGIMRITTDKKVDVGQDVLILGIFDDDTAHYKGFNKTLHTELNEAVKKFEKKWGQRYTTRINGQKYTVLGLGSRKDFTVEKVRRALGKAIGHAKCAKAETVSTNIPFLARAKIDDQELGRATAEGLLLANYSFTKYLSKENAEKKTNVKLVSVKWDDSRSSFGKGLKEGRIVAESSNLVRDLVNEPAGVANSIFMERAARKVAGKYPKVSIRVLNKPELTKLGMGSMLGVNAGSQHPPKLIILEYKGGSGRPTALVGKGITFDSGGYNLKPTKYIEDMHTDMAGSAAVLGTINAAAALGLKKNLIGVMGMCENMVSHTAQHPGDIVKSYSGKTIMIGNTDAEGRLVLADALAYTQKKYNPEFIVDLATLTGACVVALGYYTAAAIGKDDEFLGMLKQAGEASGDRVWPMPFYDDYQDWMDGSFSDLNNISQKGKGYEAGSITAGVFLSKFVDLEKSRWAHLDIAGSAHWAVTGDYFGKGATGSGVRVLTYWLMG